MAKIIAEERIKGEYEDTPRGREGEGVGVSGEGRFPSFTSEPASVYSLEPSVTDNLSLAPVGGIYFLFVNRTAESLLG